MAHRGSISSIHPLHHRSPLHLRTTISRTRCRNTPQKRALWWWVRQRDEWSNTVDEALEERIRRHHRIMRHRYAKALRRKDVWERETPQDPSWPWRVSDRSFKGRPSDMHDLPSEKRPEPKPKPISTPGQEESNISNRRNPLSAGTFDRFDQEFNSSRRAVDRSVNRHAHSTPSQQHNSFLSSFSWLFDPPQSEKEPTIELKNAVVHPSSSNVITSHSATAVTTNPGMKSLPETEIEYVFDPVSMKKVPKKNQSPSPEPVLKHKTLFETLFGEHGAPIPVKPYSPPKVYGYGDASTPESSVKETFQSSTSTKKGFESSRKSELKKLMALTLGNNIDTTAEYGGKYTVPTDPPLIGQPPRKLAVDLPQVQEDKPLFSGTTYEAKSNEILSTDGPKSDWLKREGFKSEPQAPVSQIATPDKVIDIPAKKFERKIEPSLDRIGSKPVSLVATRLQPVLDRQGSKKESRSRTPADESLSKTTKLNTSGSQQTNEDIDYLRASDVRAATKSARVTKQEVEKSKQADRQRLEADYTARAHESDRMDNTDNMLSSAKEKSNSLDAIKKHVDRYPNGIVARTMRSIGLEEKSKDIDTATIEAKTNKPAETLEHKNHLMEISDLTKKSSLKRPSKPLTTFTPSLPILESERASSQVNDKEELKLPAVLKSADPRTGVRDTDNRQTTPGQENTPAEIGNVTPKRPLPLQNATVKEGVPQDIIIENHVQNFEPRYAMIVDRLKELRRELFAISHNYRTLRVTRLQRSFNKDEPADVRPSAMNKSEVEPRGGSEPKISDLSSIKDSTTQISARPSEPSLNTTVQKPVFTPSGSSIWNDEQPPPISELRQPELDSRYVILKYDRKADAVEMSTVNELDSAAEPDSPNSVAILSKLHHAAKFLNHFPALEKAKYELIDGREDHLVFRRRDALSTSEKFGIQDEAAVKEATLQFEESMRRAARKAGAADRHNLEDQSTLGRHEVSAHIEKELNMLDALDVEIWRASRYYKDSVKPIFVNKLNGESATRLDALEKYLQGQNYSKVTARYLQEVRSRRKALIASSSVTTPMLTPTPGLMVKRQEEVFSGSRRHIPAQTTAGAESLQKLLISRSSPFIRDAQKEEYKQRTTSETSQPGIFSRLMRGVRRTVLTALTMGGFAYTIGVVAEGLGAQEQAKQGIDIENGPRKRIVMTGQRPGIFSTESSR